MLKVQHFRVTIAEKTILPDFSYTFEEGKIYAIMGPNGSGKSTLAYSIMGHPAYQYLSGSATQQSSKSGGSDSGWQGDSNSVLQGSNEELRMKNEERSDEVMLLQNHAGEYEDISELEPDERARKGIFLSFQSPLSLSGVRVFQLLQMALSGAKDPLKIRQEAVAYAKELGISEELLGRSLNEGASGGERKKMEVLQAAVLEKKLQIFDEVDTGVDVDSLKTIASFLKKHQGTKTYIIITHYNRILKYLKPDAVLVLKDGRIVQTGDHTLAEAIEKDGYSVAF